MDDELDAMVNHIFLPPKLPQKDDKGIGDSAMCTFSRDAAHDYLCCLSSDRYIQWAPIPRMLETLSLLTELSSKEQLQVHIAGMQCSDILAFHIRAQNAAVVIRKYANETVYEVFEASPTTAAVMAASGKLIWSFPGPAVKVPREASEDPAFIEELASFLAHMDADDLDSGATTMKAWSEVREVRDTAHPRYISELLIGILRGWGCAADIPRITKRIADDAIWKDAYKPWRRSPLWLIIRVTIQTSVESSEYKGFMLFLQARLLQLCCEHNFTSELLFCMRAKISRRLCKLGTNTPAFVLPIVERSSLETDVILQERWRVIKEIQSRAPALVSSDHDIACDTVVSLPNSRKHLTSIIQNTKYEHPSSKFCPRHPPRPHDFARLNTDIFSRAIQSDTFVALGDFEDLVANHLEDWTAEHMDDTSATTVIASYLNQYFSTASVLYSCAEDQSVMILTVMSLWVALDMIAVAQFPLLKDYSPAIPSTFLHPLLLRYHHLISRATVITQYLHRRLVNSSMPTSIFSNELTSDSISIRYFCESQSLKDTMRDIEQVASSRRQQKLAELSSLTTIRKSLMDEAASKNHTCVHHSSNGHKKRKKSCAKCQLEKRAERMKIEVHEWPLPVDSIQSKHVVFELQCPQVFAIWRDTTYFVLHDIAASQPAVARAESCQVSLGSYGELSIWKQRTCIESRITLASTTKSFIKSHYKEVSLPTEESKVCVNNGLHFELYDKVSNAWVMTPFTKSQISQYGVLRLPRAGPYSNLEDFVTEVKHSSNEVIAAQATCSNELSLPEFIAFGSLRSGPRLQWMNIAREFRVNALTFSREEVHLLMMQAAWQLGPLSGNDSTSPKYDWHMDLEQSHFGNVLIGEMESMLGQIESNWLEGVTTKTIALLASRLLASAGDIGVCEHAYSLLRRARGIALKWMRELIARLQASNEEKEVEEMQLRACEMAAICRITYDVDETHLHSLLHSTSDFAILIECAIVLHDNKPPKLDDAAPDVRMLLRRDQRLSQRLEKIIVLQIESNPQALDNAISSIWPSYRRGKTGWRALEPPNSRWVESSTLPDASQGAQHVHLNILEGCLLVDGKPLGRLPEDIVTHRTYVRIFGTKVLNVIPADLPGMDFATRASISDWQVSFSMKENGDNLVISARQNGGPVLQLVSHYKLSGDFPAPLVDNYVHWLSLSTGELEFRPLKSLWQSSSSNWRLHFSVERPSRMIRYAATESSRQLIDIHSSKFAQIYEWIAPIEQTEYVIVVQKMQEVSIELPRFRLGFHLTTEGALESQNFPGMIIDENQSTGTMFGLQSQLVLRPKDTIACTLPRSRHVLIPQGKPIAKRRENHVAIDITTGHMPHVSYHIYKIDTDLGYLVGTGSLHSRLYKIYLHALCSHCLPDILTGRTGTEEALHELRSAGCLSFRTLEPAEAEILRLIDSLTPRRTYYPAHLKVMQSVDWSDDLPFLSQHDGFHPASQAILQYAKKLDIFNDENQLDNIVPDISVSNEFLMQRAACRGSIFFPFDFATAMSTPNDTVGDLANDSAYSSRDMGDSGGKAKELEVFEISRMTKTWPNMLNVQRNLLKTLESWDHIAGPDTCVSLSYNKDWLKPDLSQQWLGLYNLCRESSYSLQKQLRLTFSLAAMIYGSSYSQQTLLVVHGLVHTLLSFATINEFERLDPPSFKDYRLSDGFEPEKRQVRRMILITVLPLQSTPAHTLPQEENENSYELTNRRRKYYEEQRDSCVGSLFDSLMVHWSLTPSEPIQASQFSTLESWVNISMCVEKVQVLFLSCYHNHELRRHMLQVEKVLQAHWSNSQTASGMSPYPGAVLSHHQSSSSVIPYVRLHSLLGGVTPDTEHLSVHQFWRGPNLDMDPDTRSIDQIEHQPNGLVDPIQLSALFAEFREDRGSVIHQRYGDDLEKSRRVFHNQAMAAVSAPTVSLDALLRYRAECKGHLDDLFSTIRILLSPSGRHVKRLQDAGLSPHITPRSILGLLSSGHVTNLSGDWRVVLISYARMFMEYQRSQRLIRYLLNHKREDLVKELENTGISELDAHEHPDWLLIQIEGDFLARQIQTHVAHEMIKPESGENTVLQLNMGEGKSSVIVPLVAAVLADSTKLVRVVVLKSLVGQMFQTLSDRLCGLPNRRIFYTPFLRNSDLSKDRIQDIHNIYQLCLREGGILVAQPEHLLSYKLMEVDKALSTEVSNRAISHQLKESQRWLHTNSRDLLDESDEILHVRYQLVYTMGDQKPLEDSPDRWTTIQQVLTLVKQQAVALCEEFPRDVTLHQTGQGSFPTIRILSDDAGSALASSIAQAVLKGKLPNLSITFLPEFLCNAALRFITNVAIEVEDHNTIQDYFGSVRYWKCLLLLRGLLAHGILAYVLKERRWRVDYGLDPHRSLLAVPFRAKDIPSLRAEFGHPDVAIVLTCLSYYYGGLTEQQLRQSFDLLLKLDDPVVEYEQWVRDDTEIPVVLRRLGGVNICDQRQFHHDIVPLFQRRHIVIDFFLSRIVFPKAAKEFPMKIGTSAWDLAETKTHTTTGFSGTNDNRYLLPTSISQRDPVEQLSTNARVLGILLAPENQTYKCISHSDMAHSSANLLELLTSLKPDIRVLLDVGAQMLEMHNEQLAKYWLDCKSDVSAAIYFNSSDDLCVLTRDGTVELFLSSPFNQQLDKCIVYLDDAHTRGTDLKLPRDFRAAVTLGPKVTKDRLLQGCMRMRQLGMGQSVIFFAPVEVDIRIRAARPAGVDPLSAVSVLDILRWVMLETCMDIQRHIPQWIHQGIDYGRRRIAHQSFLTNSNGVDLLRSTWLQSDSRTLEDMYRSACMDHSSLFLEASQVPALRDRLELVGNTTLSDIRMGEEQEREVAHEIERERQVERPPKMTPLTHKSHQHIRNFIRTGIIPKKSTLFLPLLQPLSSPSDGIYTIRNPWSPHLLATKDFVETVQGSANQKLSDNMRPVNWVVSSVQSGAMTLVVMSPYEVNEFLPEIRESTRVHLHQYAPRVTHFMETLEDLNFYCVPALPEGWTPPPLRIQMQLNLWAGQLYLQSYEVYEQLCTFLGVVHSEESARKFLVQSDGFVKPKHRSGQLLQACPFEESPLPALKEIIGLRRKGISYASTHMGKILHGRLLSLEDFDEVDAVMMDED